MEASSWTQCLMLSSCARFEILRKEYLNQAFNFLPDLREKYRKMMAGQRFEETQVVVKTQTQNATTLADKVMATVLYFSQQQVYTITTRKLVDELTGSIEKFVRAELSRFEGHKTLPLVLVITLMMFVPVVAYVTLQATTSMFR